jgi:hypothetical protein
MGVLVLLCGSKINLWQWSWLKSFCGYVRHPDSKYFQPLLIAHGSAFRGHFIFLRR